MRRPAPPGNDVRRIRTGTATSASTCVRVQSRGAEFRRWSSRPSIAPVTRMLLHGVHTPPCAASYLTPSRAFGTAPSEAMSSGRHLDAAPEQQGQLWPHPAAISSSARRRSPDVTSLAFPPCTPPAPGGRDAIGRRRPPKRALAAAGPRCRCRPTSGFVDHGVHNLDERDVFERSQLRVVGLADKLPWRSEVGKVAAPHGRHGRAGRLGRHSMTTSRSGPEARNRRATPVTGEIRLCAIAYSAVPTSCRSRSMGCGRRHLGLGRRRRLELVRCAHHPQDMEGSDTGKPAPVTMGKGGACRLRMT